jgi:hypothetical protein
MEIASKLENPWNARETERVAAKLRRDKGGLKTMKKWTLLGTSLVVALSFNGTVAFAQHGGGHGGGMGPGGGMGRGGDMRGGDMNRGTGKMGGMNAPSMDAKNPDQILSSHPKLSSRLQKLLPPGTNVQEAAAGFKNLGQFVAAAHVSHNLDIPFDELKSKMTGPQPEGLGKAIQQLKPDVKSKDEAKRAQKQARQDLSESETEGEPNS